MTMRISLLILTLAAFSIQTFAHEFWLEAEKFFLAVNESTPVHLYVGDGLAKDREERPFNLDSIPRFDLISLLSTSDLKARTKEGSMPLHSFSSSSPGDHILAMERQWSFIKLAAPEFEAYLREDGMDYIIAERTRLKERAKEGREIYSRYLKSIIRVGDSQDSVSVKPVGMSLEIVPLDDPYALKRPGRIRFRILFEGKPLRGRTVYADNRGRPTQQAVANASGDVTFRIDRSGMWLIRIVNMRRCTADCSGADWESFWAALTFGVR
jgi:hypothetical protein